MYTFHVLYHISHFPKLIVDGLTFYSISFCQTFVLMGTQDLHEF